MNTTFLITGGAGRAITAIPALEKYARLNPDDDFKVIVHGWENLYLGNKILQKRTFAAHHKNIFEDHIKNNKLVSPEPYYLHDYYNQKISLAEAFDREINNTEDHKNLDRPNLVISSSELQTANVVREKNLEEQKKKNLIVIQPYGSGIHIKENRPIDNTKRSMDVDDYLLLINKLAKKIPSAAFLFFGNNEFFHPGDSISFRINSDLGLRPYMSMISVCDYFIGCDSVGQHMAYAFNKPGTVLMGSSFEKNISYPEHFQIYRKKNYEPTYSPIRIVTADCEFADRLNDGIMKYTEEEIEEIANNIKDHFNQIKGKK